MQEQPISPQHLEQEHEVASALTNILSDLLGVAVSEINVDTTFPELDADSLLLLLFIRSIQSTFGVTIPLQLLLEQYSTIRDLTKYIIRRDAPKKGDSA